MKNNEPTNKKEIHAAILALYEALDKVQTLITPEVMAWSFNEGFEADDEVAIDIVNVGQNLVDIGNELDGE